MVFLTAIFSFALPIGALVYWRKRTGLSIIPFAAGAMCFLLFAMGLEQASHTFFLSADNPVSRLIRSNSWLYVLYGCLAAGIFEETGRLFGYKLLLRGQKRREISVAYGIGHGGIEVILTLGLTYVILCLVKLGISMGDAGSDKILQETLQATGAGEMALSMLERVSAMALHIGLSIVVFYAVNRPGKMGFYPLAILMHGIADLPAAMYQAGILKPIVLVELLTFILAVGILAFGSLIYRRLDENDDAVSG